MTGAVVNIELTTDKNGFTNGTTIAKGSEEGSVLSAHDINYVVKIPTKCCCGHEKKQILFNVTGVFKPGMTAIMGPTGSGKSTFLDVLAGRKDPGGVSGQLLLNEKPMPNNFKCMVGYVVQDDVVMGTLSVRENFHFSAALRLPTSVSATEKEQQVNKVIRQLGLTKCADTKVGNEFIRGVSGGERKRCNIGMELIISPPVLFLDEPTTGLDANTANTVLAFLKRLSRSRTIIFSIHQPRYSIYRLFDSLVLLSGGYVVYSGPSHQALDFFASQGFQCQEHNNPPDFFLDVINGDLSALSEGSNDEKSLEENDDIESAVNQQDKLVEGFKKSVWNERLQHEAGTILSQYEANYVKGEKQKTVQYATSFFQQIGTSLFFAIIIGAIYWQLNENPVSAFKDRSGVIFFLIMNQMFSNMSAVAVFINERKIFMHENVSGFYRVSVYFLVKILFDIIPLRIIPVAIMSCIVYFAVGLNPGADHFFLFVFALFCIVMAAASLCFLISSVVRVFQVAQLLLSLCYVLMMLFGGFLINLDSIGPWLNWVQYFSMFKYAQALLYINEFKDREFCVNSTCATGNSFLLSQDLEFSTDWDFYSNYMALLLYAACLLTLTYIQLRQMKKTS